MNLNYFKVLLFVLCVVFYSCSKNASDSKCTDTLSLSVDESNLTWHCNYDSVTHRACYTSDWSGCGWTFGDDSIKPSADFSKYDRVEVVVDSVVGDITDLILAVRYTNTDFISSTSVPVVKGKATLRLDLDSVGKSHALEMYIMSKKPCELTLVSATFKKAIEYGELKQLKVTDGFIEASELQQYSDDALLSFHYFTEGEMTFVNDTSGVVEHMDNWEVGILFSAGDVLREFCPSQRIIIKNVGESVYKCRLGDIKYMLDLKDDDGQCGIYWIVWTIGNITNAKIENAFIQEPIS